MGANDRRPLVRPALIPRQVEKDLFAGIFAARRQERAAAIPHDSHPGRPNRPRWVKAVAWIVNREQFRATEPCHGGPR
jgi:hypothetical protein